MEVTVRRVVARRRDAISLLFGGVVCSVGWGGKGRGEGGVVGEREKRGGRWGRMCGWR